MIEILRTGQCHGWKLAITCKDDGIKTIVSSNVSDWVFVSGGAI